MSRLVHSLRIVLFAAGLACLAASIEAAPTIDISFETDAVTGQNLARAQAVFPASLPVTYAIFDAIAAYPRLHDWIRKTTLVSCAEGVQEFLVQFRFPWPVGHQWSRVAVHRNGGTISWTQLEGSLKANNGQISFEAAGDNVRVDYRAVIDVGLPDALTRSYKKQFITEFLTAAGVQAGSQASLALVSR